MLENWLKPVSLEKIADQALSNQQFGKNIRIYETEFPHLKDTSVAIIGIGALEANAVRSALYQMSFHFANGKVADLGNVRKNESGFIIPLLKELLDSQIIPILICSDPKHILAQYKAFQSLQSHISFAAIDERIRLDENDTSNEYLYLNHVLLNTRSRLFHLGLIGCQSHYTSFPALQFIDRNNHDCIRLGNTRADLSEAEPIIRDADLLAFHIAALRQADAPGQSQATPSGFSAEEACQLSRYAGMSDKLKSFGVFGFQQELDRDAQTAQVVAQMIWYFLEGFFNRKNDFPVSTEGLVEYIVEYKRMDYQLTFWKSQRSNRWWMQIPLKIGKKYNRHKLIPCSYNDYKLACQDELPDRLLNAFKRFL
ncbi:MAG: hypothetical protein SFU99_12270 [Saprospiraceae bacterium]|nr:hypothetical protein [Saprospiraceae bacterium]